MEEGSITGQDIVFENKFWLVELVKFMAIGLVVFVLLCFFEEIILGSHELILFTSERAITAASITVCITLLIHVSGFNEMLKKCREELQKKEILLQIALQPRRVNFIITDQRLINTDHDERGTLKYVLVGTLQVTANESLIPAGEDSRLMCVEEYDPDVHDSMFKAPWYEKLGINPRTGRYDLKILEEFYDFKRIED